MNVVPLKGYRGKSRDTGAAANDIVAAVDIGSSKVCCLIGQRMPQAPGSGSEPAIRVLGVGHHAAKGVRNGVVVSLEDAERSIRLAVDSAERAAGRTIGEAYVNVSGGRPRCWTVRAGTAVGGGEVAPHHVRAAIDQALGRIDAGRRLVLHANPIGFDLDDARGVSDPVGMYGSKLGVHLNAVAVEAGAMRNLALAIERCHLDVAGFVIAPHAAGRSVLVRDETELGVTLIDLGGSTTSVATYVDGHLVFADIVPLGGHHVTQDLACGLTTSIAHAERVKTLHGSAVGYICDDRDFVGVPMLAEAGVEDEQKVPRSMLTGIIRPRIEEIFELVRQRLEASVELRKASRRIVLTGGGSQLDGMREAAGQLLGRHVRIGVPHAVAGLPETARAPAFAVAAGLLHYGFEPDHRMQLLPKRARKLAANGGYLTRVGRWIRESF